MPLTQRQREVLHEMGIPLWVRRGSIRGDTMASVSHTRSEPEGAPQAGAPVPEGLSAVASPSVAELDWDALRTRVAGCVACTELASRRTQTVFGVGDRDADWLFIGEAPGAEEDRRGEPFVGRAGQLLDNMLAALDLARGENVYIANILKCRPPGNRDPRPDEMAACRPFLDRQIALIAPRVVVALGRVAAQALLASEAPLGRLRGGDHTYGGIPLVVTYHPAYLLRSPAEKAKAWNDLLRARKLMLRS
ncbi:uracil-DNA glycosylase family protein [Thioalkalivibrio sp.]|uniref:uracil-DNA glycosylase n=1 Tax=Thioalkalivibrio sp. TaxID=2093813 RepID=UPI003976392E